MSLIIQFDQKTKEFKRLLFYDNNISEILESHGSSFLETMAYMHNKKYHIHPFYILPKNYSEKHFDEITKDYFFYMSALEKFAEKMYEPCIKTMN